MYNDVKQYLEKINNPKFNQWFNCLEMKMDIREDYPNEINRKILKCTEDISNVSVYIMTDMINNIILGFIKKHFDISNRITYRKLLNKLFALNLVITVRELSNNLRDNSLYYQYMSILTELNNINENDILIEYKCHLLSLCDLLSM